MHIFICDKSRHSRHNTTAPPFRCAFHAKHIHCHDRSVSLFHSHSHYRALNTAVNSINYDILCFSLALCVYVLNLSHLSICNLERKLEKKICWKWKYPHASSHAWIQEEEEVKTAEINHQMVTTAFVCDAIQLPHYIR